MKDPESQWNKVRGRALSYPTYTRTLTPAVTLQPPTPEPLTEEEEEMKERVKEENDSGDVCKVKSKVCVWEGGGGGGGGGGHVCAMLNVAWNSLSLAEVRGRVEWHVQM